MGVHKGLSYIVCKSWNYSLAHLTILVGKELCPDVWEYNPNLYEQGLILDIVKSGFMSHHENLEKLLPSWHLKNCLLSVKLEKKDAFSSKIQHRIGPVFKNTADKDTLKKEGEESHRQWQSWSSLSELLVYWRLRGHFYLHGTLRGYCNHLGNRRELSWNWYVWSLIDYLPPW